MYCTHIALVWRISIDFGKIGLDIALDIFNQNSPALKGSHFLSSSAVKHAAAAVEQCARLPDLGKTGPILSLVELTSRFNGWTTLKHPN
jgi:hypothetical protein